MLKKIKIPLFLQIITILCNAFERDDKFEKLIINNINDNDWSHNEQSEIITNCVFKSNDLTNHFNITLKACLERCKRTHKCTHFSHDESNNCWLMQGYASLTNTVYSANKKNICGILIINEESDKVDEAMRIEKNEINFVTQQQFVNAFRSVLKKFGTLELPDPTRLQYEFCVNKSREIGRISSKAELAMFLTHVFYYSEMLQRKSERFCQLLEDGCLGQDKRINPTLSFGNYYARGYLPLVSILKQIEN